MNKEVHEFYLKVSFNKPVTKAMAWYHAKQEIHGDYDIDNFHSGVGAETMKIKTIKPKPRHASDQLKDYELSQYTSIRARIASRLYADKEKFIVRHEGGFLIMSESEMKRIAEMLTDPYLYADKPLPPVDKYGLMQVTSGVPMPKVKPPKKDRYEVRTGKFGQYFYDKVLGCELALADVAHLLNGEK